ncbi:hypothetical protein PROFUN_10551 [Planoprotostelium fungivorum]|uniref:Uncharacterized protein n=1 Tax=Planoprotostelium fungivorum TaxID=1890364 RepID=A0A2P6N6S3_9EUKA|nr:hypothetical protein PROFUN_10551 [Planoprotostelium fungivorum]
MIKYDAQLWWQEMMRLITYCFVVVELKARAKIFIFQKGSERAHHAPSAVWSLFLAPRIASDQGKTLWFLLFSPYFELNASIISIIMGYHVVTLTFQSVYDLFLTIPQCSICSYQFSRLIALGTPGHPTKLIFLTGERINTGACEGASYTDEFSIALKLTFVHRSNNQKTRKSSIIVEKRYNAQTTMKNTRGSRGTHHHDEKPRIKLDSKALLLSPSDRYLGSTECLCLFLGIFQSVNQRLWSSDPAEASHERMVLISWSFLTETDDDHH